MWTHNIVEVWKNSVTLYCRSNANKRQLTSQSQDIITDLKNPSQSSLSSEQSLDKSRTTASVSWTLPNDKLVGTDRKDKYEILESGDLLIKDLNWGDMGSYVCTVSDEQSSDSISSFVYPAAVKSSTKRSTYTPRQLANFR